MKRFGTFNIFSLIVGFSFLYIPIEIGTLSIFPYTYPALILKTLTHNLSFLYLYLIYFGLGFIILYIIFKIII